MKIKMTYKIISICFIVIWMFNPLIKVFGQGDYPSAKANTSFISPSPNSAASLSIGNSLYEGTANLNFPVYEVKCGALSLPVSLSYHYNGFYPLQDAGWVGLGWNLDAGGIITRIPQGTIDNTRQSGYNYGQYALSDSLLQADNSNFLKYCYSNDSVYSYDVAPDIFCFNFNGYFGKFYWYNGKAYLLAYNKQIKIDWPSVSGEITITTGDGTVYTFGTWETTNLGIHRVGGIRSYNSAWDLTQVVSADKKDTILLNYNSSYLLCG